MWIRQGRLEAAGEPLDRALRTTTELQDRLGAALVRRTIGERHLAAGHTAAALRELWTARTAWRELGHDLGQARTLRDIGAAHALAEDCDRAHVAWRAALTTFRRLGVREAAELPAWRQRWGCRCDPVVLAPAAAAEPAPAGSLVSPG